MRENVQKPTSERTPSKSALKSLKTRANATQNKAYGTRYSQAVTHPSTNRARRCLTSVIRREPVFSTWYGRKQYYRFRNLMSFDSRLQRTGLEAGMCIVCVRVLVRVCACVRVHAYARVCMSGNAQPRARAAPTTHPHTGQCRCNARLRTSRALYSFDAMFCHDPFSCSLPLKARQAEFGCCVSDHSTLGPRRHCGVSVHLNTSPRAGGTAIPGQPLFSVACVKMYKSPQVKERHRKAHLNRSKLERMRPKTKLTAPGIPRRSPIQVLTGPDAA